LTIQRFLKYKGFLVLPLSPLPAMPLTHLLIVAGVDLNQAAHSEIVSKCISLRSICQVSITITPTLEVKGLNILAESFLLLIKLISFS
jgi:hypothetical protein